MSSKRASAFSRKAATAGLVLALALAGLPGCAASEAQETTQSQTESASTTAAETQSSEDLVSELLTDRDLDPSYDEQSATTIALSDDGTQASGEGVSVDGSAVTITQEGTYVITGSLSDGRIVVDAADDAKVQIVLAGASVSTTGSTALYVRSAKKVFVTLADGTQNTLAASGEDTAEDEHTLDAALWSHDKLTINGSGELSVTSARGHGIVVKDDLAITSGTIASTAAVDAIQSKGTLVVDGGTLTLAAGDDGIHSDEDLYLLDGTVDVTQSYEGLEGATVTIAGGEVSVNATDDGINASGATEDDETTTEADTSQPQAAMDEYDETAQVTIMGGRVEIDAGGDGIDSNGDLTIGGGETYVSGPTSDGDGALDYVGTAQITGGVIIAAGSTGMAQGLADTSTQCSMLVSLAGSAGDTITLTAEDGTQLASYTATKAFSCVVISAPGLEVGGTYTVSAGTSTASVTLDATTYSDVTGMAGGQGQPQDGGAAPGQGMGAPQGAAPGQGEAAQGGPGTSAA